MNVEIIDITDRSGSMSVLRGSIIAGFNMLVKEQREIGGEARLTHVQFDDVYELHYQGKDIHHAPLLTTDTYAPRNCTALYDAIGRTLNEQGERIAREKWADKVIVSIRTDGLENASKRYTLEQIKTMISHAQEYGWVFVFSAANQDAFQSGATMGLDPTYTANYQPTFAGVADSYAAVSASLRAMRTDPSELQTLYEAAEKDTKPTI